MANETIIVTKNVTKKNKGKNRYIHDGYIRYRKPILIIRNGKDSSGWKFCLRTGASYTKFSITIPDFLFFFFPVNLSLPFLLLVFLVAALRCTNVTVRKFFFLSPCFFRSLEMSR